ncbi:glycosyltransferase [Parasediminibacterium paludis]|uniref:Glycosyltransferase n=1 Tax=Parasediminibacterium paludis TaxID=908966 RepID=A0ABV8Q293_9BACT
MVACNDVQKRLLEQEFSTLSFLPLQGYDITYNKHPKLLTLSILQQLPKIAGAIKREHFWLDDIVDLYKIDIVISDNRYGLYSKKAHCIFITHQLEIKAPLRIVEKVLQKINYRYIQQYNACWVPDFENDDNIAGSLSHPKQLPKIPVHYIGPLSRFDITEEQEKKYDFCISLSGPEPQRTTLENLILQQIVAQNIMGKIVLVRGLPKAIDTLVAPPNVTVFNHMNGDTLGKYIAQSQYVLCRSGYTTVMELLALHQKAILIPTPGQTEQEYLAKKLHQQGWGYSIAQQAFHFKTAIENANNFKYQLPTASPSDLQKFISAFLEKTLG